MVSEHFDPRQQMVWSDSVGWYTPSRIPNPFRSLAPDRPYSSSASARRPWPFRSIASSSGSGANREARPVRPSSLSGYGGAPVDRPYSFSGYGGAPADRPYFLSGYGGGPNRSVVKVPGSTPGKIPNPSSDLGKMKKSVVRYEADASDPTAVWRVVHLRPSEEPRKLPDRVPPAEWENEKTRRSGDLRWISLNSTQGTRLRNTSEGNFNSPPTGFSVVANGRGEDQLPHDFVASPTLNNLNPSHGPELARQCFQYPRKLAEMVHSGDLEIPEIKDYQLENGTVASKSEEVTDGIDCAVQGDFGIPSWLFGLSLPDAVEHAKDALSVMDKNVDSNEVGEIQKDVAVKTNFVMANVPDEAKFYLTQLYMWKRADKRLRGTGLFWKTPPWPDFCIEELTAVYKSELMKMRHEVEEERMMLQMARVWRVERVQRKLVVAKLTVDSKYAPLNKLQSDLEEFLSFHRGNSVDEEIHKSAEESGDSRIAKKCLGMLKAMRSHHEYNYVAYRKGIGVVCNKKGGFGVDDRWLWSTGLLWNLPPWPDLSLCEADGMAIDIEKGAAAMCLRMAAMFGGIVGQEVVQACSGKFHPVYQFFYFDSIESLPIEPSESGDLKPENTRYTAQISVFGSKLQKKLEQAKIFTVGSGALGCEVLKNLALMGISCSPDGKLTVTDDDVIEQSNISRQFLVHDWNSGQPKSTVAATIVMAINSKDYVEAQMLPKSRYCYLIRLTLEYCKFSSLDADEITKESRRRLSNSFGEIRYCFNDVGLLCASEAIKICIERGQKRGWLKGASDATYQQSGANGLCLFAEISALHMKFFEEVLHLIVKRLQQGIEAFLNSESGCVGATKMGYIFQKLYELIQIFYSFCNFDHVRCLIFVNREIIAKIIERTMQKMGHLSQYTVPFITGGSFSVDVLEVVGQNYSDFVLNITSKKLKPGVPSEESPQGVISETRYPADNWNSCQFALSNGSPVHNNQSVPQSGLSYGDNDLSYIDWPGIDNFEEDNTLFRCDSTYGQQQLENTEELSWILSSDAIYCSDVALQPGFEPSYSDYGILDDLSAFNCTHDKSLPIADPSAAVYDKLYTLAIGLKVHSLTMERVTYGFSAGDWVRHKEEDQKCSQVGILHSIDRNGIVYVGWIRLDTCWKGGYSDLQVAEAYSVEQFVRLEVNISNPHFEWQRKNGGGISTDRISRILSNGCLVVNFTIKFIFGKVWSCLADPYEVEVVSFCKCEGIVKKHEHLEDFHWAVRPLLITIGIFVGKSITGPKGLKVASVSDQGGDHQQLHQQEVQKQYQCSMIPSTGGKHTFLRRSCAFWIKVNDGEFLKHLGYATPQIDPG